MTIGVIGINHETATVMQRETLSVYDITPNLISLIDDACGLEEAAVLSTCGRYEIYFSTKKTVYQSVVQLLVQQLETQLGCSTSECIYMYAHAEAVHHLYSVTCGLDSVVIGEDQILGQVKNCIGMAQAATLSGKVLNKLFREAISFAKAAKTELKISENPLSLSYIAVKKAIEGGFLNSGSVVTMVGLGKMGTLAIQYVLDQPIDRVVIATRSPEKLPSHILEHPKVRIAPFEARYHCVAVSDLVIASTSAPHTILRRRDMVGAKEGALWIDLAMPRDIDATIETSHNVTLWHVDHFKDISDANIKRRHALMALIKSQMSCSVDQFIQWLEALEIDDIFKNWQMTIKALTDEGLQLAERKGVIDTTQKRERLEAIFETLLKRMIKSPLVNLKAIEDKTERDLYVKILKVLYNYDS